ncbi:MAG: diguanylate cyclase, partial [Waterburya sp.]
LLSNIKSQIFHLRKIQDPNDSLEFIQQHHPDLIFYIFNQQKKNHLSTLLKLQEINTQDIPLILISTIVDFDFTSLSVEIDDCLIWSEMSTFLLKKAIFLALKRRKNRREAELLSQENIELSSQLLTTKKLFQTIIDNTENLVWMCDEQGESTFFNQAWSRLLGSKIETKSNSNWMINIHPQDLAKCHHKFDQALAGLKGFTISYRLKRFDNQYRWISNYAVPQFTLNGEFKGLVGYCFDITSHKKIEQKLIQRAASDRLLTQIMQKIHASLDLEQILQTTVAEVNQFLQAEKIQISRVDQGSKLTLLFESKLNEQSFYCCDLAQSPRFPVLLFQHNLAQLSAGQIVTQDYVDSPTIGDNRCSILMIPIISEDKLWGLLCIEQCSIAREWNKEEIKLLERVAMELSVAIKQAKLYQQLEQANQELEQLSVVDSLTKIANRRRFDRYIATEWARLAREQNPLSLILCDIDHFKLYNDTYGHQAGDRCLQKVAQAISKVIKRPADLVARYGGEEFVLVLPNTPMEGAKYLAQQVRLQIEALKLTHIGSSVDLYVTVSLGVSCCIPNSNLGFHVLVAAADKGLYQAKKTGRNRVVKYEIKP